MQIASAYRSVTYELSWGHNSGRAIARAAFHIPLLAGEQPVVIAAAGLATDRPEHVVAVGVRRIGAGARHGNHASL